jgi:hypothetical protein
MGTRLAEYKTELFEELVEGCPTQGEMKSDGSTFEFACDDIKCDRKEKRTRNCLDY